MGESSWKGRLLLADQAAGDGQEEVGILEILRRRACKMKQVPGGTPITYEEALELRRLLHGSVAHTMSGEYKSMGFSFTDEDGRFPFGLQVERNGCRGVIICVQAHLLRHLIFKGNTRDDIMKKQVLRPGSQFRREALVSAVCEMLWRAGEETRCCVALPQDGDSTFNQTAEFRHDGLTEKLHLYYFTSHDDLYFFMRKHMDFFESESTSGCLLFVYSLIFSRGQDNVAQELGGPSGHLLTDNEEGTQALINLMVIGRAVLGVSNQDELYDDEGKRLPCAKIGIHNRGSCGFLYWHKDEEALSRTEVGSMLKTPKHPIWVTHVNGNFGVMFSLNPDLTRDWREEHKFDLHYYTGLSTQTTEARLTIETHVDRKWRIVEKPKNDDSASGGSSFFKDEKKVPALEQCITDKHGRKPQFISLGPGEEAKVPRVPAVEQCILTKWPGAEIEWNGTMPFV